MICIYFSFFFYGYGYHRYLHVLTHSFPTRRSSDLERKTVVFVTHSVAEAVFLSDRIVIMGSRPGRIMEIMDIDLPRPRPANIRTAPEFYRLVAEVREIMGGEIGRAHV